MRDTLDVDILIVGGGPAGLSAALRLAQLQRERGGEPLTVAVVDKARDAGAHELSGAVLDPSALARLIPDFLAKSAPLASEVTRDEVYFLTARGQIRFPFTPPPLRNHGHYVISINRFVKWLAAEVEAAGVDLFQGFSASEVLYEGERIVGVRLADRGRDRQGREQSSFEAGSDVRAKVTILCDGVRGNLTKTVVDRLKLDEVRLPQVYALGIKELWEVPADRMPAGAVVHTLGYPLRAREFGGAFIYGLPGGAVSLGLVCGLDYHDPRFDPYARFQRLKAHPFVARLLDGGTRVRYGAKALPEGGWSAIPRLHMDGALIAGDAGGLLNSLRLKGIHLAMRTGMLAAEAAFDAVRAGDLSGRRLSSYTRAIESGEVKRELYPVRNVHQAFERGLLAGMAFAGLSLLAGGRWFRDPLPTTAGHARMRRLDAFGSASPLDADSAFDRRVTFDRLTSVHFSGTHHREDQPSHLRVHDTDICRTRCVVEYGNPCTRFCPAKVYEMVPEGAGGVRLQVNAANCVHCKTCDIMDPYQIIDWVPPEGGDGPQYDGM